MPSCINKLFYFLFYSIFLIPVVTFYISSCNKWPIYFILFYFDIFYPCCNISSCNKLPIYL